MDSRRVERFSPALISALGAVLFLFALVHHLYEVTTIGAVVGPLLALLVDGIPALGLVYGGYWVTRHDFPPSQETRIFWWTVVGAALWVSIMGVSMGIRAIEGRYLVEPVFELLLAADAGAAAGFIAGFYHTRARQDAQRAERATDALSFVNGILRHDIKNDLTVVRGGADLIEAKADDEELVEHAEMIRRKADEATEMVNSTDVIAETLAGEATLRPVDLTELAAESIERLEDAYDVSVATDMPETVEVLGNEGLKSVFDNLLENAAEHCDVDTPRIGVTVRTDPDNVRLRISDNGPGIPDEEKETVFESREEGVHGGGLHLVNTLVEAYGGSIWVEDNEPRGAVFVVELQRVNRDR